MSGGADTAARAATEIRPAEGPLTGSFRVPGDKSISHRAAILASMAEGPSEIRGFSSAGDCASTLRALEALGVRVERGHDVVTVHGRGVFGPTPDPVDCGRSGTTMRVLTGALASERFRTVLTGEEQLLRRPMERVAEPLRRMGADVDLAEGNRPPIMIVGRPLTSTAYRLPVLSAQVKSAVLLAGLRAAGTTTVIEPVPTRDHTERLLARMGAPLNYAPGRVSIRASSLGPLDVDVPGDISAAASLLAAAASIPGSDVVVENVGLNPTRTGFLRALARMGAGVEMSMDREDPEPAGNVRVRAEPLRAIIVPPTDIPAMVDELMFLAVVATRAEGETEVQGADELRVKESNRLAGVVQGLRNTGADIEETDDGFVVRGPAPLRGGTCDAQDDHRLAMAFAVAGLLAEGPVHVTGMEFVGDSFPGFEGTLETIR